MSYGELSRLMQEISIKAFSEGVAQLMSTQSPTFISNGEKDLETMCFLDIPQMYAPYLQLPNPMFFEPMIQDLEDALGTLCTGQDTRDPISNSGKTYSANADLDKMSGTQSYLATWTGSAAMAFKSNFIDPFPSIIRNQFLLIAALKSALEAEQAMWQATRENIEHIAKQTLKALETMHDCTSKEWTVTLSVVAAVAGVAAAIPTMGTSAVITFTAIGAAASMAGAVEIEDPPKMEISGNTVNAVIQSMYTCINKETELVNSTEQRIADSLRSILTAAESVSDRFVAKRPALADSTRKNITDTYHMGFAH